MEVEIFSSVGALINFLLLYNYLLNNQTFSSSK